MLHQSTILDKNKQGKESNPTTKVKRKLVPGKARNNSQLRKKKLKKERVRREYIWRDQEIQGVRNQLKLIRMEQVRNNRGKRKKRDKKRGNKK